MTEPVVSRRAWLAGLVSGASLVASACAAAGPTVLETPEGRILQYEADDLLVLVTGARSTYRIGEAIQLNLLVNNQTAGYMQVRLRTKLLGRADQPVLQAEPVVFSVKSDDASSVDQSLPLARDLQPGEYTLAIEVPPWRIDGRESGRGATLRTPVRLEPAAAI